MSNGGAARRDEKAAIELQQIELRVRQRESGMYVGLRKLPRWQTA